MKLFAVRRGESYRNKRVAELVREVVATQLTDGYRIVALDDKDEPLPDPGFLTVTHVRVSADLRKATIYVWPLNRSLVDDVLPYLRVYAPIVRHTLSKKLNLRYTPEISFCLDHHIDEAARIEERMVGLG